MSCEFILKLKGIKRIQPAIKIHSYSYSLLYWWLTSVSDGQEVCLILSLFEFSPATWQISRLRTCPRYLYSRDVCVVLLDLILMHVKILYNLYLLSITKKGKISQNLWLFQLFHHTFCWWIQIRSFFFQIISTLALKYCTWAIIMASVGFLSILRFK